MEYQVLKPEDAQRMKEAFSKIPSGMMITGTLNLSTKEFTPDKDSLRDLNERRREEDLFMPFKGTISGMSTPTIKGFISSKYLRSCKKVHYGLDEKGLMKIADLLGSFAEKLTSGFMSGNVTERLVDEDGIPLGEDARQDERGFIYYTGKCDANGNPEEWIWTTIDGQDEIGTFLDEQRTKIRIKDQIYEVDENGEIIYNPFINKSR